MKNYIQVGQQFLEAKITVYIPRSGFYKCDLSENSQETLKTHKMTKVMKTTNNVWKTRAHLVIEKKVVMIQNILLDILHFIRMLYNMSSITTNLVEK